MQDLTGVTQRNGEIHAVFLTYELTFGRDLTITSKPFENGDTPSGLVCILNRNKNLRIKNNQFEPKYIEELQLKVHNADCLQLTVDPEQAFDGLINAAFKRFKNVRHILPKKGRSQKKSDKELESSQSKIRSMILNQLLGDVGDKLDSAKATMMLSKREYELCQKHQADLMKRVEVAEQEVNRLEELPQDALRDQMVDDAVRDITKMTESNAYSNVEFTIAAIEAITAPIWIAGKVDRKTVHYYMGTFKVSIPYSGNGVKITPVIKPPDCGTEYPHPHIARGGSPCLGNISRAVPNYLKKGQYGILLSLMLEFLTSYNSGSPYQTLDHWKYYTNKDNIPGQAAPDKVEEEICPNCGDAGCYRCGDCDEWNCECECNLAEELDLDTIDPDDEE